MTLTATRETGTVRPTSSPTLRFLGGVGVMLLAITVGAAIITYILAMLQVGPLTRTKALRQPSRVSLPQTSWGWQG